MKISKILAVAALAVAAGQAVTANAATATVCSGAAAANKLDIFGGPGTPVGSTAAFVKTGFSVQCSANVHMAYNEVSATSFGVISASTKGNQYFGGNSNGGAVAVIDKCAAANCVAADVTDHTAVAAVAGSS